MNRRRFLGFLAAGSVSFLPGCSNHGPPPAESQPPATVQNPSFEHGLGIHRSTDHAPPVTEIVTEYPEFTTHYDVWARRVADPREIPVAFEQLSAESRVEVANAVGRGQYLTTRSAFLHGGHHDDLIAYRDSAFNVGVGVADVFEPKYGPYIDPDWTNPARVGVTVADRVLTVAITNELDERLEVHHFGRPYFGVVIAVNERAAVLDSEFYESNARIRTSGIVTTEGKTDEVQRTKELDPGGSLQESYVLPEDHSGTLRLWLSVPIGGDSIEMFGNRESTLTTTITLDL